MKRAITSFLLFFSLLAVSQAAEKNFSPVDCVNPFIGTTNFGTTNPGAVCPNGMMSVVPFNVMGSEDNRYDKDARWWSTPYEYTNCFFTGYSHVNLSGVGCPELGSLLLMPTTGELSVDYKEYGSRYKDEQASPGYYTNFLTRYNVKTEVTATPRTGVARFTFPAGQSHVLLNLGEGLTNESGAFLRQTSDTEFEGMKLLGTFCYNPQAVFPIYFVMRVNKQPVATGYWKKQRPMTGVEAQWDPDNGRYKLYTRYRRDIAGDDIGAYLTFDTREGEAVEVQMGVSFVSIENARLNLDTEQRGKDFSQVLQDARRRWNDDLSRILVEGGTEEQRTVFYTALYHTLIHPNVLQDVNGEYPAMESNEIRTTQGDRYTVFSLWDTYRNVHQLLTLVYPERQLQMVRSMLDMYREHGWLPKWELYGRETLTMEGDPSIPVIVDTWLKGLRDFDIELAYEAMRKGATLPGAENLLRPDNDDYMSLGYVPLRQQYDNSVSHALEYYIADNALSRIAEALGREAEAQGKEADAQAARATAAKDHVATAKNRATADSLRAVARRYQADARLFHNRSLGYKHYYSKEFGTFRPILPNGEFYSPFNPMEGENFEPSPGFHEGNSWNYTFYVPHDVLGLARLMGGKKPFIDKLQRVFDEGLYDPANEPDIAYAHLFSYFKGEEWRTQKELHRLLQQYFRNAPDGIPGNDDTGTMSTWAIFNMMGFYPDCPGEPAYTLSTPVFDKVTIRLDPAVWGCDSLVIETERPTAESLYIDRMELGGRRLSRYRISHDELVKAGKLRFILR
ncbi:GH92 family glycosyl hydrolase [Bacteroides sp. GD17]|jgi:predicted alpha-1,2-mannosidase|uniref:GH92 family glycosyl hydrolase n=1 Tax=Bacteroides sp. GD17 TaxID=3139826 RepID=UPI0025DE9939|nr:GH92 family glycosyl hydrolase [uncultured Bacteroides sp.]